MRKISQKYPLIVEAHPEDYDGYPFITLIRYNDENHLTIVDNMDKKFIDCYVLDLCKNSNINEQEFIEFAQLWHENYSSQYPLSIEISKNGLTSKYSTILKSFSIDYISRVIGPLPFFKMKGVEKVRKRKRKPIPDGVKVVQKHLQ